MRLWELILDIDGLWRSLRNAALSLFVVICGVVLIVRGEDWSVWSFGLVLAGLGALGAWFYVRSIRRLIREYRESQD